MKQHLITRQREAIDRLQQANQIARDALEVITIQGGRIGMAASMTLSAMERAENGGEEEAA